MDKVRLGLIGCGIIGNHHMGYFPKVEGLEFAAAADLEAAKREPVRKAHGSVALYETGEELIEKAAVDAVLIATPHYAHPTLTIAALKKGLHVLSEKPVAVTAKAAQEAIDFHKSRPDLVYAAMFMMRCRPWWSKIKSMIEQGRVGRIQRATWVVTSWFRSQFYYDSGGWRATWAGEGGGVLLNQCPHNLDLLTWLVGMPRRVTAIGSIGKYHDIEVEDDVNAILEYENGAVGHFITTTGEAPGTNRLEIAGDLGKIVCEDKPSFQFVENEIATAEFSRTTTQLFGAPKTVTHTIETSADPVDHIGITRNFVDAIRKGTPLIAPAAEGICGLELGNAMLMSLLTKKPVDIPTPRDEFDAMIRDLAKKSRFAKKAPAAKAEAPAPKAKGAKKGGRA